MPSEILRGKHIRKIRILYQEKVCTCIRMDDVCFFKESKSVHDKQPCIRSHVEVKILEDDNNGGDSRLIPAHLLAQ